MSLGAPEMNIDGLENGEYKVRLNDVGDYIPEQRLFDINISDQHPSESITLKYVEKPKDLQGVVKFVAPAKPTGESEDSLVLTIEDVASKQTFEREVAWEAKSKRHWVTENTRSGSRIWTITTRNLQCKSWKSMNQA